MQVGVACYYFCMPQNSDLISVCACAHAQMPETRLGDNRFNCKQVKVVL